ncbi:hypothetical protein [Ulvibacterium sp.]|uniref:hypothetical protein n=1 Tax=Ulvibacterium sp. TaxID=2665914 RepID=UPI003BAABFA0
MKKFFSFLAIIAIISVSNCSRIAENNDQVIGIWSNVTKISTEKTQNQTFREEWIFNDAYLGRYHAIENGKITVKTDFRWSQDDGIYTISYPGLDRADDHVTLNESEEGSMLEDINGNPFAIRE